MHQDLAAFYENPEVPNSFGGVEALHRSVKGKYSKKDVKHWLSQKDAYTLHKPVRHKFQRNRVIMIVYGVGGIFRRLFRAALPFSKGGTQTVIQDGQWKQFHPLSNVFDNAPVEFHISGSAEDYIDLSQTQLYDLEQLRAVLTRASTLDAICACVRFSTKATPCFRSLSKERQDNPYCINCETYGHTACYTKCPKFPKPRQGNPLVNRNKKVFTSNNVVEGISFANMVAGKTKNTDPQPANTNRSKPERQSHPNSPPSDENNSSDFQRHNFIIQNSF
ncbi:uncharacterized protein TNCV_234041 [Trichonephila clavipes]|nr:uncharacterized protein TNCV_234041 [Trichonephila clavipes]